jgi:hypothetical protein
MAIHPNTSSWLTSSDDVVDNVAAVSKRGNIIVGADSKEGANQLS